MYGTFNRVYRVCNVEITDLAEFILKNPMRLSEKNKE